MEMEAHTNGNGYDMDGLPEEGEERIEFA